MRNLVSKTIVSITLLQVLLLYLMFTDRLADLRGLLPEVLWMGTALLSLLFSLMYFRGATPVRMPAGTLSEIVLLAWLAFPLMVFRKGVFLLLLGIVICYRHVRRSPEERFAIVPVFSMVTGIWSIAMYLFASFITSM